MRLGWEPHRRDAPRSGERVVESVHTARAPLRRSSGWLPALLAVDPSDAEVAGRPHACELAVLEGPLSLFSRHVSVSVGTNECLGLLRRTPQTERVPIGAITEGEPVEESWEAS